MSLRHARGQAAADGIAGQIGAAEAQIIRSRRSKQERPMVRYWDHRRRPSGGALEPIARQHHNAPSWLAHTSLETVRRYKDNRADHAGQVAAVVDGLPHKEERLLNGAAEIAERLKLGAAFGLSYSGRLMCIGSKGARIALLPAQEKIMAKGQKRSNREPKKPKAEKPKPAAGSTSIVKHKPASGLGTKS